MAKHYLWEKTKDDELFWGGEHLRSKSKKWHEDFEKTNPYVADADVFKDIKRSEFPTASFGVTVLTHATTPECAVSILKDSGFKPKSKFLGKNIGEKKVIWWDVHIPWNETDVQKYIKDCRACKDKMLRNKNAPSVQGTDHENYQEEPAEADKDGPFCSSSPFSDESRYGNIMFEYDIKEVLDTYKDQYCDGNKPAFQVMGTFFYKLEIMHAILVRPADGDDTDIMSPTEINPVIFEKNEIWTWAPESTGTKYNDPGTNGKLYRRWEHAAFAFLIPDNKDDTFRLNNLVEHMAYCPPAEKFRSHAKSDSDIWPFQDTIQFLEDKRTPPKAHLSITKEQLLTFISKHLKQIWKQKRRTIEDKNEKECNKDCKASNSVDPNYIEHLLNQKVFDIIRKEIGEGFCPHKLLKMADVSSNPAERWKDWIRELFMSINKTNIAD